MEIDIQSAVAGSPPPGRVKKLMRRIGRLASPPASRPALRSSAPAFAKPATAGGGRPLRSTSLSPSAPEVSVLFCGDARMRTLNRRYRGVDRSTDVLAFPGGGPVLGDIVISLPYASREARRRGEGPAREIERLLLHGYLHLLGYDHEADRGEMTELEARLRRSLGIGP